MNAPRTLSARELLAYCQHDVEGMTPTAIRSAALRIRRKYGITAIQTPMRGWRYSEAEVRRKITFQRVPQTRP